MRISKDYEYLVEEAVLPHRYARLMRQEQQRHE
jgi:hypothetical protein